MNRFESRGKISAIEAMEEAQRIAFGPVVFQATRVLRNSGILALIENSTGGLTQDEIVSETKLSVYGVRVLLEAGLSIGLLDFVDGRFKTTKTAYFILNDKLTEVNLDYVHDVCYNGMFYLEESIKTGNPEGLKVFGNWPTIYQALEGGHLPPQVLKSWYAFDHYYSDFAFPDLLPMVFKQKPKTLLDIGGNTGKWALQCFQYDPEVNITILDLPGNVETAKNQLEQNGFGNRIKFNVGNVLDDNHSFPTGFDAIWMSQFLDCFSESQIMAILNKCRLSLAPGGFVYILELLWDRQRFKAAAFSLIQTSLYFTAMANGNSQMYFSENMIRCIEQSGFEIVDQKDQIGVGHTLLTCKLKS